MMPPAPSRWFILWRMVSLAAMAGTSLGLLGGILAASPFITAGFRFAGLIEIRDAVNGALWRAAGVVAIYGAAYWLLRRATVSHRTAHLAAAAAACLPLFLGLGYTVNLAREISPSTLFTRRGLTINMGVLVMLATLFPLAAFILGRNVTSTIRRRGVRAILCTVCIGVIGAVNLAPIVRAAAPRPQDGLPNIILIVVDSLRPDHLGSYGYGRATSPNIDALAHDSVLFRQAIAQGTYTKTSLASLFTSKWPYQHGVYALTHGEQLKHAMSAYLPEYEATLAEFLSKRGFLTQAWVRSTHVRPEWGFAQGFVTYDANQRSAATINRGFISRIRHVGTRYPFFAYLHYFDVHYPYRSNPPYDRMFGATPDAMSAEWSARLQDPESWSSTIRPAELEQVKSLYDGAIRETDERLGEVFNALRAAGLYENSLIILTSDHGEGFREHGFLGNPNLPYDELVRVPLIVKLPHARYAGTRVDRQVRHVDILPTILDMAQVAQPSVMEGCSLLGMIEQPETRIGEPGCFAFALTENADQNGTDVAAVRTERYKLFRWPGSRRELYDLVADPGEQTNLAVAGRSIPQQLERASSEIDKRRSMMRYRHLLDPETIRAIRAAESQP